LYALRHSPRVMERWRSDREFARQRLNGINPFLITCIAELPEHFPVTDENLRGVLPDGVSLPRLLDEQRVFLCDWKDVAGAPLVLGRFQAAPMALFWLDDSRTLMPLAIQLGQSPAEAPVIFTPADDLWLWLTARTYVTNADGTYHEVIAHLTRTHLVMEPVWVTACRTLPPEHPVHALLAPHFTGTININDDALTDLLAPGGPIDITMSPGSDGSFWLAEQEYSRWRLDDWNPRADLARRGVLDPDVLPSYWFRDDALALFDAISEYVGQLLGDFYRSDDDVRGDPELLAFARELVADDGGRVRGTPVTADGRLESVGDVVRLLQQVVYTVSAEHGAVNNGQWDQFGYIPNTPGALFMPPPTSKHMTNEARLVYALPGYRSSVDQMAMVHMLSAPTLTPLGSYPDEFFIGSVPAELCVDRFRSRLDDIAFAIEHRNRELPAHERYTYLVPSDVGRSITI
jgi:arachidonate 15-lipoxygenase